MVAESTLQCWLAGLVSWQKGSGLQITKMEQSKLFPLIATQYKTKQQYTGYNYNIDIFQKLISPSLAQLVER